MTDSQNSGSESSLSNKVKQSPQAIKANSETREQNKNEMYDSKIFANHRYQCQLWWQKRIYIGNIPFGRLNHIRNKIYDEFSRYGTLTHLTIIQRIDSYGYFGFLTFLNSHEAKRAIIQGQNHKIDGNLLRVSTAKFRSDIYYDQIQGIKFSTQNNFKRNNSTVTKFKRIQITNLHQQVTDFRQSVTRYPYQKIYIKFYLNMDIQNQLVQNLKKTKFPLQKLNFKDMTQRLMLSNSIQ